MMLSREEPWPVPEKSDCLFYHSMDFPDGDSVEGFWDIRGRFDQYVGNYPLAGKTVLDVGTSSGFLAFSAEAAGAKVTATDFKHGRELDLIPYDSQPYQSNRAKWDNDVETKPVVKNGFWYSWHKHRSNVEVAYSSLKDLRYTDERFDVVIAGAILEHLADPITTIGTLALLAKEAVIVAFTPVEETEDYTLRAITRFDNPNQYFSWWTVSSGLYRRIFANVGFDIQYARSSAYRVDQKSEQTRPTIIARRRHGTGSGPG